MPGRPLDDAQIAEIRRVYAETQSINETSRRCRTHRLTIRRYVGDDLSAEETPEQRVSRIAREQRERREYTDAVSEQAFRTVLVRAIREAVTPMPPLPIPRVRKSTKAHHRYPFLQANDWHFEERVEPAGVHGLNAYDIPTACRRWYRVVHALIDWSRDIQSGGRFVVPELTVGFLGDMLTGTLHGLERHSDAPNVVRAALWCGDLIALGLRDLCAAFSQVRVIGVVGNHGRLPDAKKVPTKDPTRSWDYLAYEVARRRLDGQKNVAFDFPEAYGVVFDVAGHGCYAAHGNFIPNNLGVIGYGVRRFATSLAANLNAAGKPTKYCFFGHWHQSSAAEFAGLECFIGPSLIGTQEYSFLSGGAMNRSAQLLHVFDRQLGLVSQERLYGDGGGYDGTYEVMV